MEAAFQRHMLLAAATRAAVERWAQGQVLAFNIVTPAERSNSITNILMQGRDPQPLLAYCRDKCGVILGVGLGALEGKAFRVAHMGHANAPMLFGTLGAVEMGLEARGIAHGEGGAAGAVDSLARAVPASAGEPEHIPGGLGAPWRDLGNT